MQGLTETLWYNCFLWGLFHTCIRCLHTLVLYYSIYVRGPTTGEAEGGEGGRRRGARGRIRAPLYICILYCGVKMLEHRLKFSLLTYQVLKLVVFAVCTVKWKKIFQKFKYVTVTTSNMVQKWHIWTKYRVYNHRPIDISVATAQHAWGVHC